MPTSCRGWHLGCSIEDYISGDDYTGAFWGAKIDSNSVFMKSIFVYSPQWRQGLESYHFGKNAVILPALSESDLHEWMLPDTFRRTRSLPKRLLPSWFPRTPTSKNLDLNKRKHSSYVITLCYCRCQYRVLALFITFSIQSVAKLCVYK